MVADTFAVPQREPLSASERHELNELSEILENMGIHNTVLILKASVETWIANRWMDLYDRDRNRRWYGEWYGE